MQPVLDDWFIELFRTKWLGDSFEKKTIIMEFGRKVYEGVKEGAVFKNVELEFGFNVSIILSTGKYYVEGLNSKHPGYMPTSIVWLTGYRNERLVFVESVITSRDIPYFYGNVSTASREEWFKTAIYGLDFFSKRDFVKFLLAPYKGAFSLVKRGYIENVQNLGKCLALWDEFRIEILKDTIVGLKKDFSEFEGDIFDLILFQRSRSFLGLLAVGKREREENKKRIKNICDKLFYRKTIIKRSKINVRTKNERKAKENIRGKFRRADT